jgi:hypothetical protein
MRALRYLHVLAAAVIVCGCADQPRIERIPETTFVARGRTYCSIHRVPLVTAQLFEPSPTLLIHCGDERCAECGERFPNSIDIRYSRHRNSVDRYAAKVAYCPDCEAAFEKCAGRPGP